MIASKDTLEPKSSDYVMPNSQRVYVEGEIHPEVRVPFREISLAPTKDFDGNLEPNEPVRVYDSQRPVGRSAIRRDSSKGIAALRAEWIREARGRRRLPRPRDQTGRQRLPHAWPRRIRQPGRAPESPRAFRRREPQTAPRQRRSSRHAALVCASGHHHPGDGVHCHPRKSRSRSAEGEARTEERGPPSFVTQPSASQPARLPLTINTPANPSAPRSQPKSPPSSSAPKSPAAAPSSRPTSTIPSSSR